MLWWWLDVMTHPKVDIQLLFRAYALKCNKTEQGIVHWHNYNISWFMNDVIKIPVILLWSGQNCPSWEFQCSVMSAAVCSALIRIRVRASVPSSKRGSCHRTSSTASPVTTQRGQRESTVIAQYLFVCKQRDNIRDIVTLSPLGWISIFLAMIIKCNAQNLRKLLHIN